MKLPKPNQAGRTNNLILLLAIIAIGAGGTYMLAATHADSFPPYVSFGSSEGAKQFAPGKLTLMADNHKLAFQQNGDLVLSDRSSGQTLWSSHTGGQVTAGGFIVLQTDGRIAIYATHNAATSLWSSPYALSTPIKGTDFTLSASGIGGHTAETQSYQTGNGTATVPFWTVY